MRDRVKPTSDSGLDWPSIVERSRYRAWEPHPCKEGVLIRPIPIGLRHASEAHRAAILREARQRGLDVLTAGDGSLTVVCEQKTGRICPHCRNPKVPGTECFGNDQCIHGDDGGKAECCEGWSRYCCRCGTGYAYGQLP